MKIINKADMYALYFKGAFGNKLKTWDYLLGAPASTLRFCIRYKKPGSKWFAFGVGMQQAADLISKWTLEGADRGLFSFNELGQDDKITLQGEIMRGVRHYELLYSHMPGIMHRNAMKIAGWTWGIEALAIVKSYLSDGSYDDLMELLELYPDAVIEFTTYSIDVGECRGRNTVIWEVRDY